MQNFTRWVLVLAFLAFAALKIYRPYQEYYALPMWVYYGGVVFEIALAAGLAFRPGVKAYLAAGVFFISIILLAYFVPQDCG